VVAEPWARCVKSAAAGGRCPGRAVLFAGVDRSVGTAAGVGLFRGPRANRAGHLGPRRHAPALRERPRWCWSLSSYWLRPTVPGTWIKARPWGHPMTLGIKTWAFAHLLSAGSLADILAVRIVFLAWGCGCVSRARRAGATEGGRGHALAAAGKSRAADKPFAAVAGGARLDRLPTCMCTSG